MKVPTGSSRGYSTPYFGNGQTRYSWRTYYGVKNICDNCFKWHEDKMIKHYRKSTVWALIIGLVALRLVWVNHYDPLIMGCLWFVSMLCGLFVFGHLVDLKLLKDPTNDFYKNTIYGYYDHGFWR